MRNKINFTYSVWICPTCNISNHNLAHPRHRPMTPILSRPRVLLPAVRIFHLPRVKQLIPRRNLCSKRGAAPSGNIHIIYPAPKPTPRSTPSLDRLKWVRTRILPCPEFYYPYSVINNVI